MDVIERFFGSKYFRDIIATEAGVLALKLVGIFVTYKILHIAFRSVTRRFKRVDYRVRDTIVGLITTITRIVFVLMAVFTVLDSVGINTSSLLATAGVGGVAIGFGAQTLVKDVISGFFILTEGQYFVGDDVVIEGVSGMIEEFGIRTTRIRDYDTGAIHIIPNGTITHVENRSMVEQQSRINIDVPEKYPIPKVYADITEILSGYKKDRRIISEPEVRGLMDAPERYNRIQVYTEVQKETLYAFNRDMRSFLLEGLEDKGYVLTSPMIIIGNDQEE